MKQRPLKVKVRKANNRDSTLEITMPFEVSDALSVKNGDYLEWKKTRWGWQVRVYEFNTDAV